LDMAKQDSPIIKSETLKNPIMIAVII